jgi:acyl-CoA thioesterase-1
MNSVLRRSTLLLFTAACLFGQTPAIPNPAFRHIEDTPGLPRVLLIGDSISIGYTEAVRAELQGKANVHRIPENGASTLSVTKLDQWLGSDHWDVIHFNFGLHDLKIMEKREHQVPLSQYKGNLKRIVERLKQSGARLIWASTTPVPGATTNPPRRGPDVPIYNAAASKIMRKAGIPIDDLYSLVEPRLTELQIPANVHYTEKGYKVLGQHVSESILQALEKR